MRGNKRDLQVPSLESRQSETSGVSSQKKSLCPSFLKWWCTVMMKHKWVLASPQSSALPSIQQAAFTSDSAHKLLSPDSYPQEIQETQHDVCQRRRPRAASLLIFPFFICGLFCPGPNHSVVAFLTLNRKQEGKSPHL